jgi:hypothetical protein
MLDFALFAQLLYLKELVVQTFFVALGLSPFFAFIATFFEDQAHIVLSALTETIHFDNASNVTPWTKLVCPLPLLAPNAHLPFLPSKAIRGTPPFATS